MPKIQAQPDANTGRRRGRRVSTSLSEINVIPLVDVMLVLLIIFMVAAPMMQKGVEVNLPVSRRADKLDHRGTVIRDGADLRIATTGASTSTTRPCRWMCSPSGCARRWSTAPTSRCSCAATAPCNCRS